MDPLFMATSLFRRRRFEECVKTCSEILESNPYDQVSKADLLSFLFMLFKCTVTVVVFLALARRPGS